MALAPIFKKAYWSFAVLGALYFCSLLLLLNGWVQRHTLYVHKLNTKYWHDPNEPEKFGFLKNQVRPFYFNTSDGERLHAWHVLPLGLYAEHEEALLKEPIGPIKTYESTLAFRLLARDPNSRLVVSFHGNAGHLAQSHRPAALRALSASYPYNTHILTLDYRGFGHSTGFPTENGLTTDGVSLITHILNLTTQHSHRSQSPPLSPSRIALYGQSLGTAVAVAVASHFSLHIPQQPSFRALILVAPFSSLATLLTNYAIAGTFPILGPLKSYPRLQQFFASKAVDTWDTSSRLARLIRGEGDMRVHLIHAKDDYEIPCSHSRELFYGAANTTSEGKGMGRREIDGVKLREGGCDVWRAEVGGGRKEVVLEIVPFGGHNRVTTFPIVGKAVLRAFEREEKRVR